MGKTIRIGEYIIYKLNDLWSHLLVKLGITTAVALPTFWFGVGAEMILILMALSFLDLVTGLVRVYKTKQKFSSLRLADSITKFVLYACFIITSWLLTFIFSDYIPLHSLSVTFLIVNEAGSIFENIVQAGVVLPQKALDFFQKHIEKER